MISLRTAALSMLGLVVLGACAKPADTVSASGVTLTSTSVTLPEDRAQFAPAPGGALLDANCTGCHSASMVLAQPPLKFEQWQATLTKMREVYKAPIADRDVPALLNALTQVTARRERLRQAI